MYFVNRYYNHNEMKIQSICGDNMLITTDLSLENNFIIKYLITMTNTFDDDQTRIYHVQF